MLAKLFRFSWPAAVEIGLLLGAGGEFAFVGIGMASYGGGDRAAARKLRPCGDLDHDGADAAALAAWRASSGPSSARISRSIRTEVRPTAGQSHAIVVGYGRVGKVVCGLLREHRISYIVADSDATTVTRDRREGHDVYYGDAADPQFLEPAGSPRRPG